MAEYDGVWRGRLIGIAGLVLLLSAGWYFFIYEAVVVLPPGVMAADEPVQTAFGAIELEANDEYAITALAKFSLRGKVLSRERYRMGRESDFSPIDLALGWGRMSDQAVVDELDISQGGRWYQYRYQGSPPIPQNEIERSSANMHLVPKTDAVRSAMLAARKGAIVEFEGFLVRIDTSDGWQWVSSTTRSDTGGGACEIVWVEEFRVVAGDG